ncbi:MAG: hypothetical protein IPK79_04180 [Vampirovibrionales bacterium]|nr:hypothetical protein [Vampirovibrionales bacterium]
MTSFRSHGQSLSEYGLILALVVLVAVGGLISFAPDLLNVLGIMGGSIMGTGSVAGSSSGGSGGSSPVVSPVTGTTTVEIKLSDGSVIAVPNYPASAAQAIETAGVNGATNLYVSALRDMIDQLVATGEVDATQAAFLTQLANQSHSLAEEQKYLESNCFTSTFIAANVGSLPSCASSGTGGDIPPTLRQQFQDAAMLYYTSGYNPPPTSVDVFRFLYDRHSNNLSTILMSAPSGTVLEQLSAVGSANPSLVSAQPQTGVISAVDQSGNPMPLPYTKAPSQAVLVYDQYQQALANGSLTNPAVKTVVDHLVNQILTMDMRLGNAIQQYTTDVTTQNNVLLSGGTPTAIDLAPYTQIKVSSPTHSNASDICTTGQGTDSGVQCAG